MPDSTLPSHTVPLRSWLSAKGPFPQFRSSLLDAEECLNGFATSRAAHQWRAVRDAVGNDQTALNAVRGLLAAQDLRLELVSSDGAWRLVAVGQGGRETAASVAVATLLDLGGPHRLKRCRIEGCDNVFLDWTNAAHRVECRVHPRRARAN